MSNDIIRTFGPRLPLLGVCLGHQCIGHTFGAEVVVNYRMMHGKTSPIKHNGRDLFRGMPNPFAATRYHSLVIKRDTLPDCLEITAETAEGEIMGVRHKRFPIWGVQFHPESILTEKRRQVPEELPLPLGLGPKVNYPGPSNMRAATHPVNHVILRAATARAGPRRGGARLRSGRRASAQFRPPGSPCRAG